MRTGEFEQIAGSNLQDAKHHSQGKTQGCVL